MTWRENLKGIQWSPEILETYREKLEFWDWQSPYANGPFGLVWYLSANADFHDWLFTAEMLSWVSQAVISKKAMIIYLKQPTTALKMESCCFPAWIPSVAPWSLLNIGFPGVEQGLLSICSVTSASTAPLYCYFLPIYFYDSNIFHVFFSMLFLLLQLPFTVIFFWMKNPRLT